MQEKNKNGQEYIILLVRGIGLPYKEAPQTAEEIAIKKVSAYLPRRSILSATVSKRSVDARHRDNIKFIYTVELRIEMGTDISRALVDRDIKLLDAAETDVPSGGEKLEGRPVIVGFGPAGMFAALLLAERGYRPLVLERGGSVRDRVVAVERFYKTGVLDTATNIQFGAGGAGTFSDGKLTTRIGDRRCRGVLRRLHEMGAPDDILVNAKPHIGTDILRDVVENAAERIVALGGEIRYGTTVTGLPLCGERVRSISTTDGEIACGAVILAIGHSARDTYSMLIGRGYSIAPKPFSMGVRIEHLQSDIDAALYGGSAGDPLLPPAEYNMSRRFGDRAVYTFCMCPGGEVVAAASEEGGLVVNGMSGYARDGRNANSAIAVSIGALDSPQAQIELQRRYERAAFTAGGGDYHAPVQTLGDFMSGTLCHEPSRVYPTYMNGTPADPKTKPADISALMTDVLGAEATMVMRDGLAAFGRQIRGYDMPEAIVTGVESRTSAPVRILRGEVLTAPGADNVYPCGEGAGYAGGIMSAAVDGMRCAEALIGRYAPID